MTLNRSEIAAKILERLDVKIDKDDPAFLLVELNAIAFEDLISPILKKLKDSENLPAKINSSAANIQKLLDRIDVNKEIIVGEIASSARAAMRNEVQAILNESMKQFDERAKKITTLLKVFYVSASGLLVLIIALAIKKIL